jgi:ADP-heptose:LPS heptosyltransferase
MILVSSLDPYVLNQMDPAVQLQKQKMATNFSWSVVTFNQPLLFARNPHETWQFNPPLRYILNSEFISAFENKLSSFSDLKNSKHYQPLKSATNLSYKKILIERHRERGIGDLLFLTGICHWLQVESKGTCDIYFYASADKIPVLHGNEDLAHNTAMAGPIIYDTLQSYDYHWFVEAATEYDNETDQLNVYDALFKQIGVNPENVQAKFKRPYIKLTKDDVRSSSSFVGMIKRERDIDLQKPFFIVSPIVNSNLRALPYKTWLDIITELGKQYLVIVLGEVTANVPTVDMPFSDFFNLVGQLSQANKNVINFMGEIPLRLAMNIISLAKGVVTTDSGILYIAQALNVPAISIWGTHDPRVRIGYDAKYMNLAVFCEEACPHSPCYSFSSFPVDKCPEKDRQWICSPMMAVTASQVMAKVEAIEKL